jgi:hypothetical protein
MACNCKKKIELENKYGTDENEDLFTKTYRYTFKAMIFALVVLIAIVVTPAVILVAIYKVIFKNNESIILPKFLSKYLK